MPTTRLSLLAAASLFAFLAPALHAGKFSTTQWTDDTTTGLAPAQTLWAYHFGDTTTASVNSVTVNGVLGPTASNLNFDLTGDTMVIFTSDSNLITGTGSAVMAHTFVYSNASGGTERVTLKNLTSGVTYTVSFFSCGFEAVNSRRLTFASGSDSQIVDQDQFGDNNGIRVEYTFKAVAATQLITISTVDPNYRFHLYGLALRTPFSVTSTADSGAGSLRQALTDARALTGADTITFAPALSGQTITLGSEIGITDASGVTLDATTLTYGLTISGNNAHRLFNVSIGATLALRGLTLNGGSNATGNGGAIFNGGTLTLTRCTLSGNHTGNAGDGGAIYNNGGTLTLTQCTLSGNHADNGGLGGAIYSSGTLTLTQCTLTGNYADNNGLGGALYNDGTLTLMQSTLSANHANGTGVGGAIANGGTLHLTNNIVAGNTNNGAEDNVYGTINSGTNNLTSGDPKLAPLGNYGGPTQTMPPLAGSPAIDAAPGSTFTSDQRGAPVPMDGDGDHSAVPDIGAVEAVPAANLIVQNSGDSGPGSLRQAVADAVFMLSAPTITFAPALNSGIVTLASEIVINTPFALTVDASSLSGGVTLSGNHATRIFAVSIGKNLTLTGLKLISGNGTGTDPAYQGFGGAVVNDLQSTLTLTRCTLSGNSATSGGAIGNFGTSTLTQCTLFGNSATSGGAIDAAILSTVALTQCTLSGNSATGGNGGAIFNENYSAVTLTQCILSGNSAGDGGAIFNDDRATSTMTNNIVAGNTASSGADLSDIANGISKNGANLIGNNQSVEANFPAGPLVGTAAIPLNAQLAPLGNYGGPTPTMALLPGSPARNAAVGSAFTSDQRGFAITDGHPDLGAYEAAATLSTINNYNAFIWESLPTTGNGTLTDPLHATTYDYDGDGVTNYNEWLARTNPGSAASWFRVTQIIRSGNTLSVTFPTVSLRTYQLQSSPNLTSPWTDVLNATAPGTGGNVTLQATVTGQTQYFYHVNVQ